MKRFGFIQAKVLEFVQDAPIANPLMNSNVSEIISDKLEEIYEGLGARTGKVLIVKVLLAQMTTPID